LDLVLNFIEEDTNKLELEDVFGGVEVGATLASSLELPKSKIVAVLPVRVTIC